MDRIFKFPLLIIMFAVLFACDDSDNKNDSDGGSKKSGNRSPSVVYLWVSADSTNGNIGGLDGANKMLAMPVYLKVFHNISQFSPHHQAIQKIYLTAILPLKDQIKHPSLVVGRIFLTPMKLQKPPSAPQAREYGWGLVVGPVNSCRTIAVTGQVPSVVMREGTLLQTV